MYSVSVLSVWRPSISWLRMVVVSGCCVRIGSEQSVVYFELLFGRFGFCLGLWRSVEDLWLLRGLRRRQNDANGWVLGFGVEVAQDLVKSVSGVNRCGAFVKFE